MKGFLVLVAAVSALVFAQAANAQHEPKAGKPERKYDFTLVRKDDGVSSWGSWDGNDAERFKKMGPGLYVRKDGVAYRITDPETLRKADEAMAGLKKVADQLKSDRNLKKDEARAHEMERRMRGRGEAQRKLGEQMQAYGEQMREAKDSATREKIAQKMRELGEQMKQISKADKGDWNAGEFGKAMAEFGRKMTAAAHEAGDKITYLIDQAFAKGLAKRV